MGILGDGAALVENLVPAGLITAASKLAEAPLGLADVATRLVEALAINSIIEKTRRGRRVIIKRRNLHSEQLAELTNLYFRMADIPIRFWSKVEDWQRWEVGCFGMLNGDRFRAYASGTRCVIAEKLPGESLWEHLNRAPSRGECWGPGRLSFPAPINFGATIFAAVGPTATAQART